MYLRTKPLPPRHAAPLDGDRRRGWLVAPLCLLLGSLLAAEPLRAEEAGQDTARKPAAALAESPAEPSDIEPVPIRVLTYNIHHGEGTDGQLDLQRIADVIRQSDADVVALQEVDKKTRRTDRVDQAGELARLTDMEVCFGGNLRYDGGDYGNAVLSRFLILSYQNHPLPNVDDGEPRGLLEAQIAVPGMALPLRFLCTHLDHRRAEANRLASVTEIERIVADQPGATPTLLAGDLNAVPESETIERLLESWRSVHTEPLPTFPASNPDRQIDYIFYLPAEQWETVESRVLDEPIASDHAPLLAVLRWQGSEAETVFRDDLRSQLKDGWSWIREDRDSWRPNNRGLEIRVEPGNMWGPANDAKNVLVRPAPDPADGTVVATVTVENRPTEQYEQANLVWYYDDSHMVKIGQELVDGQLSVVMGREQEDRTTTINIIPIDAARVQLRFVVDEEEIRGLYRLPDEDRWQEAGRCSLPGRGEAQISLQGYQGPADQPRWATFTDFSMRQRVAP